MGSFGRMRAASVFNGGRRHDRVRANATRPYLGRDPNGLQDLSSACPLASCAGRVPADAVRTLPYVRHGHRDERLGFAGQRAIGADLAAKPLECVYGFRVAARRCSRHFGSAGRKGIRSTRLSSPFVWIGPQPNRFRSTSLFGPTATRLDESQRAEQFESCALPTRYVERGIPVRCSGRSAPPEPPKRLLMPGVVPKMAHNHNASLEPRGARSVGRNACYG